MAPKNHNNMTPWPFAFKPMQRIHIDICGPFINDFFALIVIDSYSKYPQVYFSKKIDTEFTISALRRFFADEGVPQILVSDNGPQFRSESFRSWLTKIGVCQLFTPARHPQSNGQAENFVRTLKGAIQASSPSNSDELFKITDNFLLQYRMAEHSTTKRSPCMLFKGRQFRGSAAIDSTRILYRKGVEQLLQTGIVIGQRGNKCLEIVDIKDGSLHMRHRDQVFIPLASSTTVNNTSTSQFRRDSNTTQIHQDSNTESQQGIDSSKLDQSDCVEDVANSQITMASPTCISSGTRRLPHDGEEMIQMNTPYCFNILFNESY